MPDAQMHQSKKGNQWHFGMKSHIGADRDSDTAVSTAVNISDVSQTAGLSHGKENQVHADAGYLGSPKRDEVRLGEPTERIDWQIARKRKPIKDLQEGAQKEKELETECQKASVRAYVEHPFHILKNLFHHYKTRYRGLAKNHHKLQVHFGLINLVLASRQLAVIRWARFPTNL